MHATFRSAGGDGESTSRPLPPRIEEVNAGYVEADSDGTSTMIFACGDILLIACNT